MAFDRAAAKAAGYSDEEIDAYLQANPEVAKDTPPAPAGSDVPPPPTTKISEIDHTASTVATLGAAVPEGAKEALELGAKGYGIYKGAQLANAGLKALNRLGQGSVAPSVSPSGVQMTGVGSPGNPIGGAAVPESAAAGEGMAARGAQVAGRAAAPGAGSMALPLAAFSAPYLMAAQEQAKIRANPNAPGLEHNPYAQTVRGEYATQGQAGAANARQAVASMPTGYTPSAEEARNLLASGDQRMIQLYGGVRKLQAIANPNAINSGYAQELTRLGR